MVYFRSLCLAAKRVGRGYCTFEKVIKSPVVQKYFDGLASGNLGGDSKFVLDRLLDERKDFRASLRSLEDLERDGERDDDFSKMIEEERKGFEKSLLEVESKILDFVALPLEDSHEVIVEISAGVGGQEAMLFASDLRCMYLGYVDFVNWSVSAEDLETSDIGGIRHTTLYIEGRSCFKRLSNESGIHRVQRIPTTEKNGRIHTSTVSVAVFAQPQTIDVQLNDKDLVIETKRSSGAGGQHVNKTESAVRITHIPTGISVESQEDRSQIKNRRIAYNKLCAKLYSLRAKELSTNIQQSRKNQVGTRARSDKIRTYNFPQDRITDHRLQRSLHNMELFLQGGQPLHMLLDELVQFAEKERLESFILSLNNENSQ